MIRSATMQPSDDRPPLRVLLCSPCGFCASVVHAIETVERALAAYGAVYVRHEIVHNKYVVEGLKAGGAIFIVDLDAVACSNAPVVLSARGVPKAVFEEAKHRQLLVVDATCPRLPKFTARRNCMIDVDARSC